jgi:hypothetical protein
LTSAVIKAAHHNSTPFAVFLCTVHGHDAWDEKTTPNGTKEFRDVGGEIEKTWLNIPLSSH